MYDKPGISQQPDFPALLQAMYASISYIVAFSSNCAYDNLFSGMRSLTLCELRCWALPAHQYVFCSI
jgi:hypothetical protein